MSHTYTNLLAHFVFSTKDRLPLIRPAFEKELYSYLGGLFKELKGKPIKINGVEDHLHALAVLPPTIGVAEAMKFVKGNSSKWLSKKFSILFDWQVGYGAFSVNRSSVDAVVRYIENQKEHHRKVDFRTEFIELLVKHEVEFDERYLWK